MGRGDVQCRGWESPAESVGVGPCKHAGEGVLRDGGEGELLTRWSGEDKRTRGEEGGE